MFRYGAALESYTGFLLLCAAMTYLYLDPSKVIQPLCVIGATYLLICGGHPQIAYLGLIGAALMCLLIPSAVAAIRSDLAPTWGDSLRYYARAGSYVGLGLVLASAYTLPFYIEFVRDAPSRVGQSYVWSLAWADHLAGAMNSFFNPLRSDVHGAFGSSSLILLAMLAPLPLALTRKDRGRGAMMAMWVASVTIFLCSVGPATPLYHLFWKLVPFADSFRGPGRIAMMLPPLFMFMLAWFFSLADQESAKLWGSVIAPWHIALAALAAFLVGYLLLAHPHTGSHTPFAIRPYPSWISVLIFICGLASLLLVTVRVSPSRMRATAGVVLAAVVIAQSIVQLRCGTWVQRREPTPTLARMDDDKKSTLEFRGVPGWGMESASAAEPLAGSPPNPKSSSRSYKLSFPLAMIFPARTMQLPLDIPPTPHNPGGQAIPVYTAYTSFNRLTLKLDANAPGFLTLTVPYSPNWRAAIDGQDHRVQSTDRKELAVFVPSGAHEVDLRFHSPSSVAGMALSSAALIFVAALLSRHRLTRGRWAALILAVVVLVIGGFARWEYSLYGGDDLGMQFRSAPSSW